MVLATFSTPCFRDAQASAMQVTPCSHMREQGSRYDRCKMGVLSLGHGTKSSILPLSLQGFFVNDGRGRGH